MSELTEVIDNVTGELERFRDMHAETLIEHAKERDRWAARIRELEAALRFYADGLDDAGDRARELVGSQAETKGEQG